jgi:hypothetical protein
LAKLVYVPPPPPIPFALPILVTLPVVAFQMARVGMHMLRGPGAAAEGHSHLVMLLLGIAVAVPVVGLDRTFQKKVPARIRAPRISWLEFGGKVVLLSAVAGLIGLRVGSADISEFSPMVLIDTRRIVNATLPVGSDSTVPSRLLVGTTMRDTVTLLGQPIAVEKDSTELRLAAADGTRRLSIPLPALELPQQIEIVPMRAAAEPEAFAILVTGSVRSNQAMIAVVDSAWAVVFLERVYRSWPASPRVLSLARDSLTNFDILMVARAELTQRLYRFTPQ